MAEIFKKIGYQFPKIVGDLNPPKRKEKKVLSSL
jgi:hypothetical protein